MANRVCIQRCEFVDIPDRKTSYGFRAYDDYDQCYVNTAPEEVLAMEPLTFLAWVNANVDDQALLDMFENVRENECGLYVDDKWLDWDEICSILVA
jgi:hypothetical protein